MYLCWGDNRYGPKRKRKEGPLNHGAGCGGAHVQRLNTIPESGQQANLITVHGSAHFLTPNHRSGLSTGGNNNICEDECAYTLFLSNLQHTVISIRPAAAWAESWRALAANCATAGSVTVTLLDRRHLIISRFGSWLRYRIQDFRWHYSDRYLELFLFSAPLTEAGSDTEAIFIIKFAC
jgi:hypothetical protein